jgi:hypothetical protein
VLLHNGRMEPRGLPPRPTLVIARLRRARRWLLLTLGVVAVALLPWIAYLSLTLPSKHVVHHWQVAWVGLDIAEAAALIATFVALLKRSPAVTVLASIAGTLLVCDAWFDVITAQEGSDLAWALAFALLAELPLAALCFWLAFEVGEVVGAIVAEERVLAADLPPTAQPARRAAGRRRART